MGLTPSINKKRCKDEILDGRLKITNIIKAVEWGKLQQKLFSQEFESNSIDHLNL